MAQDAEMHPNIGEKLAKVVAILKTTCGTDVADEMEWVVISHKR